MRTELMAHFRQCISTEGDTGMLIAADAMEESADTDNQRFGELLRLYVEIQTLVRMSMPVPADKSARYVELNQSFQTTTDEYRGAGFEGRYQQQLGPFFTKFTVPLASLAANMAWLEDQPIRQLELTEADVNNDLKMVLRNHRMDYMTHLTIRLKWRQNRQEAEVGRAMAELSGSCLQEVILPNIENRLKIVPAMFIGNRKIPKGCTLVVGRQRVAVKK